MSSVSTAAPATVAAPTAVLTVSDPAAAKLLAARDSANAKYVRVTCKPGGCSGFLYDLKLEGEYDSKQDTLVKFGRLTIVVDSRSANLLRGTELEYVTEDGQTGFKFRNPNKPDPPLE